VGDHVEEDRVGEVGEGSGGFRGEVSRKVGTSGLLHVFMNQLVGWRREGEKGSGNRRSTTDVYQRVGMRVSWRSRDFAGSCLDTRVVSPYNWWLSLNTRRLWRTTGLHYEIPVRRAGSHAVRERWRATKSSGIGPE
jgi:hypothetical protein